MGTIEGGCLCGRVRYTSEGDALFTAICHCSHCQKQSGSAFSVVVGLLADQLSVSGTLADYEDQGDSGKAVHRRFCPACGSAVLTQGDANPAIVVIKAGTLDDTSWLDPTMAIYAKDAQKWLKLASDMVTFPGAPPAG